MSKTFKSADYDNRELVVDVCFGEPRLMIKDFDGDNKGFFFKKADIPAIMLALGEAAGWPNEYLVTTEILRRLREFDKHLKAIETEAKDKAKLEAEALKLLLAFQAIDDPDNRGCEWHQYGTNTKDKWLAVARKAREMAKEENK